MKITKMKKKLFFVGLIGMGMTLITMLYGCKFSSCANNGNCSITYGGIRPGTTCGASNCAVPLGESKGYIGTTVKCDCN